MKDIILVVVLLIIVAVAGLYIYKAKKSGTTCIGCPHSKSCHSKSCCCESKTEKITDN